MSISANINNYRCGDRKDVRNDVVPGEEREREHSAVEEKKTGQSETGSSE